MITRAEKLSYLQENNDRTMELYRHTLNDLHLTEGNLRNKKILDIGAGLGRFAYGVRQRGINCAVVELDYSYVYPDRGPAEGQEAVVGGDALHLPFRNNYFDIVLSIGCVPILFAQAAKYGGAEKVRDITRQALDEALRVTAHGGEVRMHEIPNREKPYRRLLTFDETIGLLTVASTVDNYIQNLNLTGRYLTSIRNSTLIIYKRKLINLRG